MGYYHSSCIGIDSRQSEDSIEEDDSGGLNHEHDKEKDRTTDVQNFKLHDIIFATNNFEKQIWEGGFGKVYKGIFETGQIVAVKCLDENGRQGDKFIMEVLMLRILRHSNLVNLVGYCIDNNKKLLVYEYLPKGRLCDHLFDLSPQKEPLDWNTRWRIALGAAKGLEYLHLSNPPVIHRDLKTANILLNEFFNPKLANFGLARIGPVGDQTHVSSWVIMGSSEGYCAPEYAKTGKLTLKSDIYSFGVVILELLTGRKACGQNLVNWARPLLYDCDQFMKHVDPTLDRWPSKHGLEEFIAILARCLQEDAHERPCITDIVSALKFVVLNIDTDWPFGYCNHSPSLVPI